MFQPKRQKYRKQFRGKMRGNSTRGATLAFGDYGIKAQGRGWITARQIEAVRRVLVRSLRRGGRMWIRIFPDKPITARAAGHRMGGGKGDIEGYVAVVTPGRILFEITGIDREIAKEAIESASKKLPIATKFIAREEV